MPSRDFAFLIYKPPIRLQVAIAAPFEVKRVVAGRQDLQSVWKSAVNVKNGLATITFNEPGVYGINAVSTGASTPAIQFSLDKEGAGIATWVTKADKDPWPKPPPAPFPSITGITATDWGFIWRDYTLPVASQGPDYLKMFMINAAQGPGKSKVREWHRFDVW